MQVEAVSVISTFNLKGGDILALAPSGKSIQPLPQPKEPKYDIRKIIIKEKLAKQNLRAFGFQSYNEMEL